MRKRTRPTQNRMGQLGVSVSAKREGRFGYKGHQQLQYGITWKMGVESYATQRGAMG